MRIFFRNPLADEIPWFTYGAIRWLEAHVKTDWRGFEFGSGGSTAFFRRRVRQQTSGSTIPPGIARYGA